MLRNPESPAPSSSGPLEVMPSDYYSPSKNKISKAYLTRHSTENLRCYGLILVAVTCVVTPFLPIEWSILALVYSSCSFGLIASLWLSRSVLQSDDGTAEMRGVSDPIREGAEGFLSVQYTVSLTAFHSVSDGSIPRSHSRHRVRQSPSLLGHWPFSLSSATSSVHWERIQRVLHC